MVLCVLGVGGQGCAYPVVDLALDHGRLIGADRVEELAGDDISSTNSNVGRHDLVREMKGFPFFFGFFLESFRFLFWTLTACMFVM